MLTKFGSYINEKLPIGQRLNETIINPNFSIVVPGRCNGKCSFCFWKQSKVCENYIDNLVETLNTMPSQFYQLSLTGGEPTLSPYFDKILENIDRNKWKHTVLTTNGSNILKYIPKLKGKIDHVNISRHHYDDEINESIFGTDTIPDSRELRTIVKELNKIGIDVTYSAVLTEDLDSREGTLKYIEFAKRSGARQVFLRKQHGTLSPTVAEQSFSNLPSSTHSCPVCRNTTQKINGMTVVWKASLEEPSKSLGMIYEVIHHEDGTLTSDWEQEIKIEPTLIKENVNNNFKWEDGIYECGAVGHGSYGKSSRRSRRPRGCGGGSIDYTSCGSSEEIEEPLTAEEQEKYNRKQLLARRKRKIGKIENKIKEKNIKKDNFYGGGYISTFDSFQYNSNDAIYECGGGSSGCGGSSSGSENYGCGGGSYSGCGSSSSKKKTKLLACNGGEIASCGGSSDDEEYISKFRKEEDDIEEIERQEMLKHRRKVINNIKRELKERPEKIEEPEGKKYYDEAGKLRNLDLTPDDENKLKELDLALDNLLKNVKKLPNKKLNKSRRNFYGKGFTSSFSDFIDKDEPEE